MKHEIGYWTLHKGLIVGITVSPVYPLFGICGFNQLWLKNIFKKILKTNTTVKI